MADTFLSPLGDYSAVAELLRREVAAAACWL